MFCRFYSSLELLHAYTMTLAAGVQQQAVNHRGVEAVPDRNWKRFPPVHQSPWYALSPDPSASDVWTTASARYCESWLHTPPNLLPNSDVKHAPGHSWLYRTTVNLLQQRPCTEHGRSSVSAWLSVLGVGLGVEMKSNYESSSATDTAWLKKSLSSIPYLCSGNSDKLSIKVVVGVKQFNRGKHFDTWPFPLQYNIVYCPQNCTISNQFWELGSDSHSDSDKFFLGGICYKFKFLGPASQRLGNLPEEIENPYPLSGPSWMCMYLSCASVDQMSFQLISSHPPPTPRFHFTSLQGRKKTKQRNRISIRGAISFWWTDQAK